MVNEVHESMQMQRTPSTLEKPRLSIIIAFYDSGSLIERCLESLENQSTDQPFEILVVDSSSNGMPTLIRKRFPHVRLYQFRERKFCGDARNLGLSAARGEIIAFIDADCTAEGNWVDQILEAHQSPHLAIGGAFKNGNPENLVSWAAYFCELSQWMPGLASQEMKDIPGGNMSYKRTAFEKYGVLLQGTYCSDTDFHWRLAKYGHRLRFVPSMIVSHHNIDQLKRFLRHEFEHGRCFARVRRKHQNFSKFRRWLYTTFSFLIPSWLFFKIGLNNLRNRTYLPHFLKAWPLLILGLISWSLGECAGYMGKR
jgi:GT2 family glycosyltransferase